MIDLTEETEAESDARALRVGIAEYDAQNTIKQEEVDDSTSQDTASEYLEDSDESAHDDDGLGPRTPRKNKRARRPQSAEDLPDNMDEAEDMMTILWTNKNMLEKRKQSNKLRPGDATRLRELDRETARLEKRVAELLMAERDNKDKVGVKKEDTGTGSLPNPPAAQTGAKRKRNTGSQRKVGPARKRAKGRAAASAAPKRGKGSKAAEEGMDLILEMLQTGNSLTAGQEMADLPLLQGVKATTVRDQNKQLRKLTSTLSGGDRKQIQGDNIMIVKARAAMQRRYKVANEKFLINGMQTALLPYQFAAVGWMVQRERAKSDELAGGGLLADTMGLGKTVQMLACISANPPSDEDIQGGRGTTLVVVPASAAQQWVAEINRHCRGMTSCQYKQSNGIDPESLKNVAIW